jgi:hypothetical protein
MLIGSLGIVAIAREILRRPPGSEEETLTRSSVGATREEREARRCGRD